MPYPADETVGNRSYHTLLVGRKRYNPKGQELGKIKNTFTFDPVTPLREIYSEYALPKMQNDVGTGVSIAALFVIVKHSVQPTCHQLGAGGRNCGPATQWCPSSWQRVIAHQIIRYKQRSTSERYVWYGIFYPRKSVGYTCRMYLLRYFFKWKDNPKLI